MAINDRIEECVKMADEAYSRGRSKMTMLSVMCYSSLVFALLSLFIVFLSAFSLWIMLIPAAAFGFLFFFLRIKKQNYVFECDYVLVGGSLRIAKVLNGVSRKALTVLDCSSIEQLGRIDSENYKRYETMPDLKKIMATPNVGYNDENIYYVFFTNSTGRKLLIFEPSSVLLLEILKSSKKNVYVK